MSVGWEMSSTPAKPGLARGDVASIDPLGGDRKVTWYAASLKG
jgi:hypothetical protein